MGLKVAFIRLVAGRVEAWSTPQGRDVRDVEEG
jgi:hypothetical protein